MCNNINHYYDFCNKYNIKIKLLLIQNFDDLVEVINNCKFFIGNLSAPLAIAYSLHKPCYAILSNGIDDTHVLDLNKNLKFMNYFLSYENYSLDPENIIHFVNSL